MHVHMQTHDLLCEWCHAKSHVVDVLPYDKHVIQAKSYARTYFFITGPSTTINSGAGKSTTGTSEHTEEAFQQPVNNPSTNNAESVSEMAIVPAMPTSTPLNASTVNTQVDETVADTEMNDETDDEAQGDEEDGQSEVMVPQPPYVGQRFGSFEDAKEFYQRYAMFHVFAVNTEYHRKIKKN